MPTGSPFLLRPVFAGVMPWPVGRLDCPCWCSSMASLGADKGVKDARKASVSLRSKLQRAGRKVAAGSALSRPATEAWHDKIIQYCATGSCFRAVLFVPEYSLGLTCMRGGCRSG